MGVVLNSLDKEQTVVVGGNHFHFKANEIKYFHNNSISNFLTLDRADHGFMGLPDEMVHLAQSKPEILEKIITPEDKEIIKEKKATGIENYCKKLRAQVYNLQVSLLKDLRKANDPTDPRIHASKGDVQAMEELVKYQSKNQDADELRLDKIKKLEAELAKKK